MPSLHQQAWQKLKQQHQQLHQRTSALQKPRPTNQASSHTKPHELSPVTDKPNSNDVYQPEWSPNPQVYHPSLPPPPPPKVRMDAPGDAAPQLPPRPPSAKYEGDQAQSETLYGNAPPPVPTYDPPPPPPPPIPAKSSSAGAGADEGLVNSPQQAVPPVPAKIPIPQTEVTETQSPSMSEMSNAYSPVQQSPSPAEPFKRVTTADDTTWTSQQLPLSPSGVSERRSSTPAQEASPDASPSARQEKSSPVLKRAQTSQSNSEPSVEVVKEVVEKVVEKDPYEDFDPFYKSSLARFVAMLRQEMAAESDDAKYRIFASCVVKETRLRKALYDVQITKRPEKERKSSSSSSGKKKPESDSDKGDDTEASPKPAHEPQSEGNAERKTSVPSGTESAEKPSEAGQKSDEGSEIPQLDVSPPDEYAQAVVPSNSKSPAPDAQPKLNKSDTSNTIQGAGLTVPGAPSRGYTPFRYSPGPRKPSRPVDLDRPAHEAYSDLRQQYSGAGRVFAGPAAAPPPLRPGTVAPSPSSNVPDETFLGVIRAKSLAYNKRPNSPGPPVPTVPALRINKKPLLNQILAELRDLLPDPLPTVARNPLHDEISNELKTYHDEFGWVKERTYKWDKQITSTRYDLQQKRKERQEALRSHIDGLFNDQEMGQQDIGVIEAEFKQMEAQKQLNEERREYHDFMEKVFKPVESRLDEEISGLLALQKKIRNYFASATTSSDAKHTFSVLIGFALTIFNKLECRYEQKTKASIDLERRRKQAERIFFVVLDDKASLKKLDADFYKAEQRAALHAARDRNDRANKVMDMVDDTSSSGLGANQRLLEEILAKASKIVERKDDFASNTESIENEAALRDASVLVRYLGTESENIVQYLSVAEASLNNSDYELSVWQARVRDANRREFLQMEQEKKGEDEKLRLTARSRAADVQREYNSAAKMMKEARELVRYVTTRAGQSPRTSSTNVVESEGEAAVSVVPEPPPAMAEDEAARERWYIALDEAKQRQAAKSGQF